VAKTVSRKQKQSPTTLDDHLLLCIACAHPQLAGKRATGRLGSRSTVHGLEPERFTAAVTCPHSEAL
jgi:hypothetical protein